MSSSRRPDGTLDFASAMSGLIKTITQPETRGHIENIMSTLKINIPSNIQSPGTGSSPALAPAPALALASAPAPALALAPAPAITSVHDNQPSPSPTLNNVPPYESDDDSDEIPFL